MDPDVTMLGLYREVITEGHSASALTASSVASARALLEGAAVDLVLCDFTLPDGSAADLYECMRRAGAYGPDQLVVCTGFIDRPDVQRFAASTGVRVFAKPITASDLQRLLR